MTDHYFTNANLPSDTRKITYNLILGNKERDEELVSFRKYGEENTTTMGIDEFISLLKKEVSEKK